MFCLSCAALLFLSLFGESFNFPTFLNVPYLPALLSCSLKLQRLWLSCWRCLEIVVLLMTLRVDYLLLERPFLLQMWLCAPHLGWLIQPHVFTNVVMCTTSRVVDTTTCFYKRGYVHHISGGWYNHMFLQTWLCAPHLGWLIQPHVFTNVVMCTTSRVVDTTTCFYKRGYVHHISGGWYNYMFLQTWLCAPHLGWLIQPHVFTNMVMCTTSRVVDTTTCFYNLEQHI